jgi:hypothetical protein
VNKDYFQTAKGQSVRFGLLCKFEYLKNLIIIKRIFPVMFAVWSILVSSSHASTSPEGAWRLARQCLPDEGMYEGDKVMMAIVDVNGDQVEDLIVGSAMQRNGSSGVIWQVLTQVDGANKILSDMFSCDETMCAVFIESDFHEKPRLYGYQPEDSSPTYGQLIAYNINNGALVEVDIKKVRWEDYKERFKDGAPKYHLMDASELYMKYDRENVTRLPPIGLKQNDRAPKKGNQRDQEVSAITYDQERDSAFIMTPSSGWVSKLLIALGFLLLLVGARFVLKRLSRQ